MDARGRRRRRGRHRLPCRRGEVLRAARAFGLRHVHGAAPDRRPGGRDRRVDPQCQPRRRAPRRRGGRARGWRRAGPPGRARARAAGRGAAGLRRVEAQVVWSAGHTALPRREARVSGPARTWGDPLLPPADERVGPGGGPFAQPLGDGVPGVPDAVVQALDSAPTGVRWRRPRRGEPRSPAVRTSAPSGGGRRGLGPGGRDGGPPGLGVVRGGLRRDDPDQAVERLARSVRGRGPRAGWRRRPGAPGPRRRLGRRRGARTGRPSPTRGGRRSAQADDRRLDAELGRRPRRQAPSCSARSTKSAATRSQGSSGRRSVA